MARARLRDRHQDSLRRKLQVLKAEQAVTVPQNEDTSVPNVELRQEEVDVSKPGTSNEEEAGSDGEKLVHLELKHSKSNLLCYSRTAEEHATDMLSEYFDAYEAGGYSPKFLNPEDIEPGTIVVTEEDDTKRIEFARHQVSNSGKKVESVITKEELLLQREARKGMGDDEAQFSVEAALDNQVYLWSDKYRPRKPRYFNRVHTGFEWNKYNQTHYDMDNPPPKIVQGYKFNIFYPDLIDKNNTPEYFLVSKIIFITVIRAETIMW